MTPLSITRLAALLILLSLLAGQAVLVVAQQEPSENPTATLIPGGDPGTRRATASKKASQIKIECDDPQVNASVRNFANQLLEEWRQLLDERDDAWAFPLEILVSGAPGDVVDGPTAVIPNEIELLPDGSFRLQLYVRLHNRYDQTEVNRRFIQLMLYEMMVRPFAGKTEMFTGRQLNAPFWLIRGIEELIKHRANGRPSDLFAGIVKSRKVLSISEILNQQQGTQPLDPVTDAVFGASSAALVAALLDQDKGTDSFRSYLASLTETGATSSDDPGAGLRQHFPGLRGSPGALEKWWTLQVASMGQLQAFEFFSARKTDTMLTEALMVDIPAEVAEEPEGFRKLLPRAKTRGPFTGRLHDYDRFLDHPNAKTALEQNRLKLRTLGLRAFPVYRGVILRYEQCVLNLIGERTRGMADELESLDQERQGIHHSMSRVEDYMNYFEATQAEGTSEAYEQYRAMKRKLEGEGKPARNDRISRYLDAMEREFQAP